MVWAWYHSDAAAVNRPIVAYLRVSEFDYRATAVMEHLSFEVASGSSSMRDASHHGSGRLRVCAQHGFAMMTR
jgi:hypothetical protein